MRRTHFDTFGKTQRQAGAPRSESGIALVITLILLAVITFMAVTFLVIARHEGAQTDTMTQQTVAKMSADDGLQQALAQIVAQMQATQNGLNFGLLVSTNWMTNYYNGTANLTDVSYHGPNGQPLSTAQLQQMLNNLLILPRAPVFITTNPATPYSDFRYWLDLNRNGLYDTNGAVVELDPNTAKLVTNFYTGDPEWVGILNHPEQRHSPSNYFVARYCFIALPIGNSLDVNYIHNQSKLTGNIWLNGFLRNQGIGSWELNLAGFLHELNTNWDALISYNYVNLNPGMMTQSSTGASFDDATQILQYRYGTSLGYNSLRTFNNLYAGSPFASSLFRNDFIDGYAHGPLMTNLNYAPGIDPDFKLVGFPWSGDYSSNQYFTTQDLFNNVPYYQNNATYASTSFSNHLYSFARFPYVSTKNFTTTNSYNRYTFYRMLSQLSFGSAAESSVNISYPYTPSANPNFYSAYSNATKMNLNYVNVGGLSATNFVPWTPVQFFTNAADRMLRAYFPNPIRTNRNGTLVYLSITNIPIYPTNFYTPAVHRILQLAANMYDASTNRLFDNTLASQAGPFFPSVFKPYFAFAESPGLATNIYIAGYVEVSTNVNPANIDMSNPLDLRRTSDMRQFIGRGSSTPTSTIFWNIYGIPYVIGARQGLPAFDRFAWSPVVTMSRKIEIVKPTPTAPPGSGWLTNIQYTVGVSNVFGADCWYPYTNTFYGRSVTFYVTNDYSAYFTNNQGAVVTPPLPLLQPPIGSFNVAAAGIWPGTKRLPPYSQNTISNSFVVPLNSNSIVLADSVLRLNPRSLVQTANYTNLTIGFDVYNNGNGYLMPRFGVNITNRLRLMMVDTATGRLIDYVQLAGGEMDQQLDITSDLQSNSPTMWSTNVINPKNLNSAPIGIINQIAASIGPNPPANNVWSSIPVGPGQQYGSVPGAITGFNLFMSPKGDGTTTAQVPLVAFTKYQKTINLSINDPLVHYTVSDLTDATATFPPLPVSVPFSATNILAGVLRSYNNNRVQSWSYTSTAGGYFRAIPGNEWAYKDPLAISADMWQFPTNKYPTVGWLGRVHRGTPWQTVYLKSAGVDFATWAHWTGDSLSNYFGINDPQVSQPYNDWLLMDLFTTAPNDNASKGQLSINQSGAAAWAAVLDGMIAITNNVNGNNVTYSPWVINPTDTVNGTNTVEYLVNWINFTRNNAFRGTFTSLGQILSVPQLTLNSPYLNYPGSSTAANQGLNDAAYERIPQQMMSLLRLGTPRYVIFAYGQSLKPAPGSIVTSGPYFGMCTNYQITGEVATRSVVRFDNIPLPILGQAAQPRAVVESFNVLPPGE